MNLAGLRASLADASPPPGLTLPLEALWWDASGDWNRAHTCAMRDDTRAGAAVHAYLHRKEGDQSNARYWYTRAGRPPAETSLDDEWEALAREFLAV
jgi:hypothetical protein